MSFPFAEMQQAIMATSLARPRDVAIRVDSLDRFSAALTSAVDLRPGTPNGVQAAEFCGIKVIANDITPLGMAVIEHDGEIVNIIRYAEEN